MKRILVVSPNKSLWDFSKPLLFLGEWCNLFKDINHNKKLDIQINPYHWKDEQKKSSDYFYLNNIYENKLKELNISLSNIHSLKSDERYWRIIIGPWLKFFIDAIFDRYESVRMAKKLYKIDFANIYNYKTEDYIPNNFDEFYDQLRYDNWNEIIYFETIKELNISNKTVKKKSDKRVKKKSFYFTISNKIKNTLNKINSLLFNNSKKIILYELYIPYIKLFNLQLKLIQLPYTGSIKSNIKNRITDLKNRNKITLKDDKDDFIRFLNKQIKNFIPRAYLEHFNELKNSTLQSFPKDPKLIVTANAYQANDNFKIWAAYYSKRNVPIIIHQHGGTFGISKYNQTEKHQLKISDHFISWGWKKNNYNNISVLPALKLSSKKINYKIDGDILLTLASTPRYFYNFFGIPNGPDFLEYIQDQKLFINKLNPHTYSKLRIREDSTEFGWEITNRILDSDYSKIDKSTTSFRKRLKKSKICISTYNATIFLETLSMNFPTIIFFNSNKNKIRSEALDCFKNLKDVGIFHEDPISAANFLNNIENDIQRWWFSKEVQKQVHIFCFKFAYTSDDWKEKWTNFLIDKKND